MSKEILAQLLIELQDLNGILSGFCDPPKARYIYANRQYDDCLWYFWNGSTHEPIAQTAITAVVEKVETEEKDSRGKTERKLNVTLRAGKSKYVLQSGADTLFGKGLLYTLSKLPASSFGFPVMIAVEPGTTDTVLFCKIYNPVTSEPAFAPYVDGEVDWVSVLSKVVAKVESSKNV